jgi:hypothetical protein
MFFLRSITHIPKPRAVIPLDRHFKKHKINSRSILITNNEVIKMDWQIQISMQTEHYSNS